MSWFSDMFDKAYQRWLARQAAGMSWVARDGWVNPVPRLRNDAGVTVTPQISSPYGSPRDGGARIHRGVDIMYAREFPGDVDKPTHSKRHYMPTGVIQVVAVGPGVVSKKTGRDSKGRLRVTLDHSHVAGFGPLATFYTHLERILVDVGDSVVAGQVIGVVGATGTDLNHLHFEMWFTSRGPKYPDWTVDPAPWLASFGWTTVQGPHRDGPGDTYLESGSLVAGAGEPPSYPTKRDIPDGVDSPGTRDVPWRDIEREMPGGNDGHEGDDPLGAIIVGAGVLI